MMRTLLFLCLIFFSALTGFAQEITSSMISVHEDDKVIRSYICISGQENIDPLNNRLYHYYYQHKIHSRQGGFSGNLLDGNYTEYDQQGNLLKSGQFKNGLKQGRWSEWQENGNLKHQQQWKFGRQHGPMMIFNTQGNLTRIDHFKKGKQTDKSVEYENGKKVKAKEKKVKEKKPKEVKTKKDKKAKRDSK